MRRPCAQPSTFVHKCSDSCHGQAAGQAAEAAGLPLKPGVTVTRGEVEPSTAWELWESKGRSWLAQGWSVDAITTASRGGLGIAKDLIKRPGLEVDLGAYVTQEYEGLFRGRLDPQLGVGLSVSF